MNKEKLSAYVTLLATVTLTIILLSMVGVLLVGLFVDKVDNSKIFEAVLLDVVHEELDDSKSNDERNDETDGEECGFGAGNVAFIFQQAIGGSGNHGWYCEEK